MRNNIFRHAQVVKALYLPDSSAIITGSCGVEKITVVVEANQTLWFATWRKGKIESKYNAVYILEVEYEK